MHGIGEFKWKDEKHYIGYYINDKKEGFGIHFWKNANRLYIGFWKDGRQDGIGRYVNPQTERWGLWKNGSRVKWYASKTEAFANLAKNQVKYSKLLTYNIDNIVNFFK
jgi:hypothetical protein